MSALIALALAAALARVESVSLTAVESRLAMRVIVSGMPGVVTVYRERDAARISIADTELGQRFAGGRRLGWTPQDVDEDVRDRMPAWLEKVEIKAKPSEVSLLLRPPSDASIDVRRDASGLLILFMPAPAADLPPPVATTPTATAEVEVATPDATGAPVPEMPHFARAFLPGGVASAQAALPVPRQAAPEEREYRLRVGDQLRIVVYFHPNLSQEIQIRPDGRIAFPIAGDLAAAGRTPAELGRELTHRLERELRNADATVIVQRFADLRVYIGGEVNNPGVYPLVGPTTTLQALVQAGGTKRTASLGSVFVIRNQEGAPSILQLDLRQFKPSKIGTADGGALQPLDVVFVPKSGITKFNDFVDQYITKVIPATVVLGLNYNFGNLFLPSK